MFSPLELTGRASTHVVAVQALSVQLHRDVAEPFAALRDAARRDGIDLQPVSAFRDFARQLLIWNAKCRGERELQDRDGTPLQAALLDPGDLVTAVLHWSALPGASRHHWGTEVDVIDAAALPPGARARLVPSEFARGGNFARLEHWLGLHMHDFGFYRPYQQDRGGVQPEPWHLSHALVAQRAMQQFSLEMLRSALAGEAIEARSVIEARLPDIYERYVRNVDPAPPAALAAAGFTRASTPS